MYPFYKNTAPKIVLSRFGFVHDHWYMAGLLNLLFQYAPIDRRLRFSKGSSSASRAGKDSDLL